MRKKNRKRQIIDKTRNGSDGNSNGVNVIIEDNNYRTTITANSNYLW